MPDPVQDFSGYCQWLMVVYDMYDAPGVNSNTAPPSVQPEDDKCEQINIYPGSVIPPEAQASSSGREHPSYTQDLDSASAAIDRSVVTVAGIGLETETNPAKTSLCVGLSHGQSRCGDVQ